MTDIVVLLHGIARTHRSLSPIGRALRDAGFDVLGITYPSRRDAIAELGDFVAERLAREGVWRRDGKVHFVTHSMGGLVLHRYLAAHRDDIPAGKLGRAVMIGPPHRGSEVADALKDLWFYKWFYGPAGQELTTAARARPAEGIGCEVGIIAGSRGWPYFIANRLIPRPHDGRVAVEATKLPGMADHITVPATHSLILRNAGVARQVVYFLKEGHFAAN
jgi:triacylglycerol lipase